MKSALFGVVFQELLLVCLDLREHGIAHLEERASAALELGHYTLGLLQRSHKSHQLIATVLEVFLPSIVILPSTQCAAASTAPIGPSYGVLDQSYRWTE
jgi:hypothetical protein